MPAPSSYSSSCGQAVDTTTRHTIVPLREHPSGRSPGVLLAASLLLPASLSFRCTFVRDPVRDFVPGPVRDDRLRRTIGDLLHAMWGLPIAEPQPLLGGISPLADWCQVCSGLTCWATWHFEILNPQFVVQASCRMSLLCAWLLVSPPADE